MGVKCLCWGAIFLRCAIENIKLSSKNILYIKSKCSFVLVKKKTQNKRLENRIIYIYLFLRKYIDVNCNTLDMCFFKSKLDV